VGEEMNGRITPAEDVENNSLAEAVKATAQDFFNLAGAQLKLAKVELGKDLRFLISRLIALTISIPPFLLGYTLGMTALVKWLASNWGQLPAMLVVAAINLVLGGTGIVWAISTLKRYSIMDRTTAVMSTKVAHTMKSVHQAPRADHG
jgi:uncharacterized membrane protein YqjE